jgi:glucose/arabinose dehydrogenase
MLAGASQFGHTFDPWGRHFLVSNADHVYVEGIRARYLDRNPDLVVRYTVDYIPDHGNAADVFPITRNPEHQLLTDRGVFTSASGITYYTGGAFPAPYDEVVFVAESVHNLVHVDRIAPKGASFRATRVFEDREFLASTDGWFRPVQFYVGPDGALYFATGGRRFGSSVYSIVSAGI